MNTHIHRHLLLPLCLAAATLTLPARGATLTVIYNVTSQNVNPTGIIEGAPGLFYATTSAYNLFAVTTQGTATTLASFKSPPYGIVSDPGATSANALFYSSVDFAPTGSYPMGNVFSVGSSAGSEKIYATESLVPMLAGNLPGGKLFGIVSNYTNNSTNLGTTDLTGHSMTFYQFSSHDRPGTPIYSADGNYYGTAGSASTTYLYRATPSGLLTQVATLPFLTTAYYGAGLVLQGTDGNFYGIQSTGLGCPTTQHGGVYKLTPSGQYTLLHDFGTCLSGVVNSLVEGSDGKLYGATQGNSVLFSVTKSGVYQKLFQFNGANGICPCFLLQGSDGNIYGAAQYGGSTGAGTIFALNAGLPVPKPRAPAFYPKSGPVGTQVRIWGYNLFGASVQFNDVAATGVHNGGPNYVWATVPTGATTGPITVTTPGGTVTTKASFTVQ